MCLGQKPWDPRGSLIDPWHRLFLLALRGIRERLFPRHMTHFGLGWSGPTAHYLSPISEADRQLIDDAADLCRFARKGERARMLSLVENGAGQRDAIVVAADVNT